MSNVPPAYRPLIIVQAPRASAFQPRGGGSQKTAKPSRSRQGERLDGQFDELERLTSGRVQPTVDGGIPPSDPELVVVFEVVQETADLADAFKLAGLELMVDVEDDIEDEDLGEDFARLKTPRPDAEPIKRYLHAAMANEEAVRQLLSLWRRWKSDQRMRSGFGAFTKLFQRLYNVRPWDARDRIRTTGLSVTMEAALADALTSLPINIELWFRQSEPRRRQAEAAVRALVVAAGGEVLNAVEHVEIGYHAIAASVPPAALGGAAVVDLEGLDDVAVLQAPDVIFVRPAGQSVRLLLPSDLPGPPDVAEADELLPPLVAVLDGLPEANHPLLKGRVEIVDPDDLAGEATYTSDRRRHGTMVTSAVVWGDLGAQEEPTRRLVAARPVMRPDMETLNKDESIPWDQLPPDITIRAVRDLVGFDGIAGAAPSVRIVNLSLGDPLSQFDTIPSAWARAIDWLAFKHNLLFIVSAGNHLHDLPIDAAVLASLSDSDRDRLTADAIAEQSPQRRLMAPAESMNAATVGALHADASSDGFTLGYRVDVWSGQGNPSPVTAHGRGIRRSIKPDVAAPGGRQLYGTLVGEDTLRISVGRAQPPGVQVAAPPDRTAYVSGTTFAAAEVSRRAACIMDTLISSDEPVDDRYLAVATKALLAHGTNYPLGAEYGIAADRLVGHGALSRDLSRGCAPQQATLLYVGQIESREEVELTVPLPEEIGRLTTVKRVSTTLAWLSPINWNHRQYRRAKLTIDGPVEMPSAGRSTLGLPYRLTQRGTLEHRVFGTDRAYAQTQLTFKVRCADQAGGLDGAVPFAVAISLELGVEVGLDVYALVRQQVVARVRVQPTH